MLIGGPSSKYNFVLWNFKELMIIYKYDFEHENAYMFMIFKGSYGLSYFYLKIVRSSAAKIPSSMLFITHSVSSRKPGTVDNKYLLNLSYRMTTVPVPKVLSTFPNSSGQN